MRNNQQTPTPVKVHDLKIAPEHFTGQLTGTKTFELRADDRGFEVGHVLCLREYAGGEYTGRTLRRHVVGLLRGPAYGLQQGWVILSTAVPDLITIRKPTTRQEAEWLAKIAHLLVKDINQTLDELLATPEQKEPHAS